MASDIREIVRHLVKHSWIIVLILGASIATYFVAAHFSPGTYKSTLLLRLDERYYPSAYVATLMQSDDLSVGVVIPGMLRLETERPAAEVGLNDLGKRASEILQQLLTGLPDYDSEVRTLEARRTRLLGDASLLEVADVQRAAFISQAVLIATQIDSYNQLNERRGSLLTIAPGGIRESFISPYSSQKLIVTVMIGLLIGILVSYFIVAWKTPEVQSVTT